MARRRFFVQQVRLGEAEIRGEEAHHLTRVLRIGRGERYEISDNQRVYLAEVVEARKERVVFSVLEEVALKPPLLRLTVLVALVKFDRFEWAIEKLTELGAERLVPVVAIRSEKGLDKAAESRLPRWRKIARESSQQSRRDTLPEVLPAESLAEALKHAPQHRFLLDENPGAPPLLAALPPAAERARSDSVALMVGPEGGWTGGERSQALERAWRPVSMGALVMRTETAAVAAAAIISGAWQESAAGMS